MESEALRRLRTMRQIRSSLDVVGKQKVKTTNSLSKTDDEIRYLESLTDPRLAQALARESQRFAMLEARLAKSRGRMLKLRKRLAATVNRNRAVSELRRKLQRTRWEKSDPPLLEGQQADLERDLCQVELRY